VAQQYRSDAEALVRAEAAARMAKVQSKKAVQEELNKQLALKVKIASVSVCLHMFG
jgi:hypothetical protein